MESDEVKLWAPREGLEEKSRPILKQKMDHLRTVAYDAGVNLAETKLEKISRCFLALDYEGVVLPETNMKICEQVALKIVADNPESKFLTIASVVQEEVRKLHQEFQQQL